MWCDHVSLVSMLGQTLAVSVRRDGPPSRWPQSNRWSHSGGGAERSDICHPTNPSHSHILHRVVCSNTFSSLFYVSAVVRSRGPGAQSPTVCLFPLSDFTLISHIAAQCVLISMAQASNNDNSLACIVWPWIVANWQRMNMDSMCGPFVLFYIPLLIILGLLWLCSTSELYCVQPCTC